MATISNTLFIGKVLIKLETVDSTNDYSKRLLSNSKPVEGTAIIAYQQHQGRGQYGNEWLSEPGSNLTFSIILYPSFLHANQQFGLTQAVALGIVDTLQDILDESIFIKWPNDIYCKGKKIAGILIENTLIGNQVGDSIIGIGLNVNQQDFSKLPQASSLSILAGKKMDIDILLQALLTQLEKRYLQLRSGQVVILDNDYKENLYRLNEKHWYKAAGEPFEGTIVGYDSYGRLLVQKDNVVLAFSNKEIEFL
ncbi:MAG: biotin--[acetyl-CoA-carboxylase] ligase [Chitinophagales bacterium]|nr:biotin--[acetyl-CoA-carboxylase] ligase [Chitinophagales bacterium]